MQKIFKKQFIAIHEFRPTIRETAGAVFLNNFYASVSLCFLTYLCTTALLALSQQALLKERSNKPQAAFVHERHV